MKKLFIIIIILFMIFIGMFVYKNLISKSKQINVSEVEIVENYINNIYLEKEIVGESLPYFESINEANEKWIFEVIKKNLEDDKITYEQLQEKSKELFGEDFKFNFPKEGTDYLKYNEEENYYEAISSEMDNQGSFFLLNKIEKVQEGFEVEIVEYLEDYSEMDCIIIQNLNQEEISRTSTSNEEEGIEIVKRNIDNFTKKKILLKYKDQKLTIQKVYS